MIDKNQIASIERKSINEFEVTLKEGSLMTIIRQLDGWRVKVIIIIDGTCVFDWEAGKELIEHFEMISKLELNLRDNNHDNAKKTAMEIWRKLSK